MICEYTLIFLCVLKLYWNCLYVNRFNRINPVIQYEDHYPTPTKNSCLSCIHVRRAALGFFSIPVPHTPSTDAYF